MTKQNNKLNIGHINQEISMNEKLFIHDELQKALTILQLKDNNTDEELAVFEHVRNSFLTMSSRYETPEQAKTFTKLFT
jgi:hypothetical protein